MNPEILNFSFRDKSFESTSDKKEKSRDDDWDLERQPIFVIFYILW